MNAITQRFCTTPPPGGRFMPFDEESLSSGVANNQSYFQDMVDLDNGPRDQDPRPGHLSVAYSSEQAGGGKKHQLEAIFTGQPWKGDLDTKITYRTEDTDEDTLVEDTHWHIAGGRMERATMYFHPGDSKPAGGHRGVMDPANPQLSGVTRWDAAALKELF